MKTTKNDFERFKKEFLKTVELLGLKEYRIAFYHKYLEDDYAQIHINHKGLVASIIMTTVIYKDAVEGWCPVKHGKHEAIHLLTARLTWLASCRYVDSDAIDEEDEKIVRRLEKIL